MTDPPSPFDAFDLPPPWPAPLLEGIRARNGGSGGPEGPSLRGSKPIVVLDDDPLGGQCVRDVPVLTTWDVKPLAAEMERSPAFLLLTNTRALPRNEAVGRAEEIGFSLREAALRTGVLPTLAFRSDSTLRGHFYWEMSALAEEFALDGMPEPVFVFLPYFGEVGRYTLHDVQYVLQDLRLLPVAETEYARDPAFAFEHSYLPSWLQAHSEGHIRADDVVSVSLDDIRLGGPNRVAYLLRAAPPGSAVVVNAIAGADIEVFVAGLQQVEAEGGYFIYTGAASFVRARLGQEVGPHLTRADLGVQAERGGLTIVGSYVENTTAQLERVLAQGDARSFELDVQAPAKGLLQIAGRVAEHLAAGEDVVLYTSRAHKPAAAASIAVAVEAFVRGLGVQPGYLLVKGGSTASHVATDCLGVKRALVLGQLMPGVPVWRLGDESRWPGLPFVIFPGNVGTSESLAEALRLLRGG